MPPPPLSTIRSKKPEGSFGNGRSLLRSCGKPFERFLIDVDEQPHAFDEDILVGLMRDRFVAGELRTEPDAVLEGARISAAADGNGLRLLPGTLFEDLAERSYERAVLPVEDGRLMMNGLVRHAELIDLMHDIGKGAETESEANHAEIGGELVKRLGEDPRVINCVLAHHNDVEPSCIESVIVQVADAISAARPGARRESLDNYIKRLESLEGIAKSFDGVDNAFAIQAGRELRIMVNSEKIGDDQARTIAKGIAERIEAELRYPGKIKVTIIRETRFTEYAR